MKSHLAPLVHPEGTEDAGGKPNPALSPSASRTLLVKASIEVKLESNFSNEGPFHALQEPLLKSRALSVNPRSFPATNHPLPPANEKEASNCVPPAGISIRALELFDHWSKFECVPRR